MRERPVDDARFRLGILTAEEVAGGVLHDLETLYAGSYHNSHMYERLLADVADPPEVFRLFVLQDIKHRGRVVGARAIQLTRHEFVDYQGYAPLHGKRFSVLPDFRGHGLGRRLLRVTNRYVFEDLDEPVLFGESNEIGALSMHCRAGALVHVRSVADHFPRNTDVQALAFFAEFLANRKLRGLRLPTGNGVQFVNCRDETVARTFLEHGYAKHSELLAASNCTLAEDEPPDPGDW